MNDFRNHECRGTSGKEMLHGCAGKSVVSSICHEITASCTISSPCIVSSCTTLLHVLFPLYIVATFRLRSAVLVHPHFKPNTRKLKAGDSSDSETESTNAEQNQPPRHDFRDRRRQFFSPSPLLLLQTLLSGRNETGPVLSRPGCRFATFLRNSLSPLCSIPNAADDFRRTSKPSFVSQVLCLETPAIHSFPSDVVVCKAFRSGSLAKIGVIAFLWKAIIRKSNGQIATCTARFNLSFNISVSVGVVQPFGLVLKIQK
ncbi:hypothetical protein CDAR_544061 [Caerostris darwini]|uniref:Uncharacterized protein n=1 Tax=Caerostris darwini TaxID=1538125 RepID=A0AAV4TGP3_9ARAC|nr:hypothetical protein CDAR_544061 [Caerostris darwini]